MTPAEASTTIRARTSELIAEKFRATGIRAVGLNQADYAAAHDQATAEVLAKLLAGWATWESWPGYPIISFGDRAVVELAGSRVCLVRASALREGPALVAEDETHVDERNIVRCLKVPK